jgi:predicted metal-dependent hydrolase
MPTFVVDNFIKKNKIWIENKLKQSVNNKHKNKISEEDILKLKAEAKNYIPNRVQYLAEVHNVEYNNIKITSAKTRWGSCTSKKNINFSYRLIKAEKKAIDYVIIHEFAHLKFMNHSKEFWNHV